MKKALSLLIAGLTCWSCITDTPNSFDPVPFDGTGYKPVYATAEEVARIEVKAAEPLADPGKIYTYNNYLFINEKGRGIHIIDNADAKNPKNLSFVAILSNYDMAVKGNWLYADNHSNLLVLDISDPKAPRHLKTIQNAIPADHFPAERNIYFECADSKKGIVVGWEKVDMAEKPKCFR